MAARRPFWKWQRWKSIGFCLWPPSTCIWNLKLKFQSKLDLCSGNHVVYRQTDGRTDGRTDGQTDGRTDKVNPVYPPSNFVGRGYNNYTAPWPLEQHWKVSINRSHKSKMIWALFPFKTLSRCGKSLCTDKTVSWPFYLHNVSSYTGKRVSLYQNSPLSV